MSIGNKEVCPDCLGTGKEICDNPDHGFLDAIGTRIGHANGCPCCGNSEDYTIANSVCFTCKGSGAIIKQLDKEKE